MSQPQILVELAEEEEVGSIHAVDCCLFCLLFSISISHLVCFYCHYVCFCHVGFDFLKLLPQHLFSLAIGISRSLLASITGS